MFFLLNLYIVNLRVLIYGFILSTAVTVASTLATPCSHFFVHYIFTALHTVTIVGNPNPNHYVLPFRTFPAY